MNSTYNEFEVILVDNGSNDGSLEYIKIYFSSTKRLKVVALEKNYGYAQGNNIGYNYIDSQSKYVIFLNNDIEVESNCIIDVIEEMEKDPQVGAAQPKIKNIGDRSRIYTVGGITDYYGRTVRKGKGKIDLGQYDSVSNIFCALGAAIFLRKEVIEEVGLFDPSFFAYYEDTDLCWRIWLAGYKVIIVPSAVIYHLGGGTADRISAKDLQFRFFHRRKNNLAMLLKNYSVSNIIVYAIPFSTMTFLSALFELVHGKYDKGLAYLRAISWIISNMRELMKKRKYVQKVIRKFPDSVIMKQMKRFVIES